MNKKLLFPAVLLGTLLSACNQPQVIIDPAPAATLSGNVKLSLTEQGEPSGLRDQDAAGRALQLSVDPGGAVTTQSLMRQGLSGASAGRLAPQAITVSGEVLGSALVGGDLRYSLSGLSAPSSGLSVPRSEWPSGQGVSCVRDTDTVSDPLARTAIGRLSLDAGGSLSTPTGLSGTQVRPSPTGLLLITSNTLVYAERDLRITAKGHCQINSGGSPLNITLDIDQELRAGWNVVSGSVSADSSGALAYVRVSSGRDVTLWAAERASAN